MTNDEMIEVFGENYDFFNKYHTVVPILGGKRRWGTLLMARYDSEFSDEDLVLAEYGATIVGLEIQRNKLLEQEEEERERQVVQMAIGTLSYSEVEAVCIYSTSSKGWKACSLPARWRTARELHVR